MIPAPQLPILLSMALTLASAGFSRADQASSRHFLIGKAAPALSPEHEGIRLNVYSGTIQDGELTLYIGFQNTGDKVRKSFGALTRTDFALFSGDRLTPVFANLISSNLTLMSPPEGTLPGLANAGSVRYTPSSPNGPYKIRVAGFSPISFDPDAAPVLQPVGEGIEKVTLSPLGALTTALESLAVIRLHVEQLSVSSTGEVRVDLAFENFAHRDLTFSSPLTGKQCYLIDSHGRLHVPVEVSDSLANSIGPESGSWMAGGKHQGWVRYQVDNPHALNSLSFSFPEYSTLIANFEPTKKTYDLTIQSRPGQDEANSKVPLVAAAGHYRELAEFFNTLTTRLDRHEYDAFLQSFSDSTPARQAMSDFLVLLSRVPVRSVSFRVPRNQNLDSSSPDQIRDVVVYVSYQIGDIARPLIAKFRCDLARASSDQPWLVEQSTPDRPLPFWLLGYQGVKATDHFLLFYRPDSASDDKINKAARQVERAYRDLSKVKGLGLDARFPAFFIDREDDFALLTGRDPKRFNGAVASITEVDGDQFITMSGGLYINDFKFLSPSNIWGASEREKTITHELVHLVLSRDTRPFTPLWLVEGTAVHLAGQNNSFTRQSLRSAGALNTLSLQQLSRAVSTNPDILSSLGGFKFTYIYSGEVVDYLVRTYGEERFFNFYRAFADYSPTRLRKISSEQLKQAPGAPLKYPMLGYHLTQQLIKTHFDTTLEAIDTEVKAYLHRKTR